MYPNPYGNQQGQGIGFNPNPSQPPYPPQGQAPGYPPSPYPPSQGSVPYPPSSGYPVPPAGPYPTAQYPSYPGAAPPPAYPASGGYPTAGGYPQQTGYPQSGYPQQQPGYPAPPQQGYGAPPAQPQQGYGAPPAYPQQQQQSAYSQQSYAPPQQQAFQQSAYPTQQGAYPGSAPPASAMQQYDEIPTLRPGPCDPSADAQALRKAMKGFGTDEKAIINILGKRTDAQRQQIAQAFKASFGKDLIKDLKSELGGRLEEIVVALMTPRYDLLAQAAYKAMSGIGTKEKRLVDILCTSTNNDIRMINASYVRLYGKPLEKDLMGDTSGSFGRLLVSICAAGRNENPVADPAMAADDAQKLLKAGVKQWGTDESMFNMILATRSYAQLRLMFHQYESLSGHAFEKAVQREFSGDVETGMLAVVKSAKSRAAYFAERIHESVAGMGTKDEDLIFLIVSRADVDLESCKTEYLKMYGKPMESDVKGDTGGDYQKMLLALLGV